MCRKRHHSSNRPSRHCRRVSAPGPHDQIVEANVEIETVSFTCIGFEDERMGRGTRKKGDRGGKYVSFI